MKSKYSKLQKAQYSMYPHRDKLPDGFEFSGSSCHKYLNDIQNNLKYGLTKLFKWQKMRISIDKN